MLKERKEEKKLLLRDNNNRGADAGAHPTHYWSSVVLMWSGSLADVHAPHCQSDIQLRLLKNSRWSTLKWLAEPRQANVRACRPVKIDISLVQIPCLVSYHIVHSS